MSNSPKVERKLAAIMFTDIAGYTESMSYDESQAITAVKKKRSIIQPLIKDYNGIFVKEIGDGTLSYFSSAIDASTCAVKLQELTYDEEHLNIRVGLHIGDIVFDGQDEVSLCGYELTTVDFTGTRIVVSLYAALFDDAPAIINYVRLETLQLTPFDKELSFSDMKKLELYPYTMEIIKNNTLFESLERNNSKASAIIHESSNNYLLNKGKILKEFYMGGYDLHVEFIKGYPIHIPIPQNIKFLNAKIDLIDHCLIELRKNEKNIKIPEENYLKEASYRIQ